MIYFGLARIKETIHPKTSKNYRVWPLLNLAVAVCDKELKITHAVRGKDQQDGVKKERIICDYLNWNKPEIIYFGMINFEGMELSKTKIKLAIERNEFDSWEDIRLPFLAALRKRGYKAEALRRFALDLGLTENDKTVDKDEFFKLLNYHQKQIIELKEDGSLYVNGKGIITAHSGIQLPSIVIDELKEHIKSYSTGKTGDLDIVQEDAVLADNASQDILESHAQPSSIGCP